MSQIKAKQVLGLFSNGTVATAAGTAAKTVTISGYTLATGDTLSLSFTNGNSAGTCTLAVNGGTAYNIKVNGSNVTSGNFTLAAAARVLLYFDGLDFHLLPGNTGAQGAQGTAGTNGAQGAAGAQGATGTGLQGAQGATGAQGSTGSPGPSGAQGAAGTPGSSTTEEAIAINVVPASKDLSSWYPTNEWRDAFVVIPLNMDGLEMKKLVASYGDLWPNLNENQDWYLELRDTTNTVVASEYWSHPGGQRVYIHTPNAGFMLTTGYTLNVKWRNGGAFPTQGQGYTVTGLFI